VLTWDILLLWGIYPERGSATLRPSVLSGLALVWSPWPLEITHPETTAQRRR
jgi:hypothetical protein